MVFHNQHDHYFRLWIFGVKVSTSMKVNLRWRVISLFVLIVGGIIGSAFLSARLVHPSLAAGAGATLVLSVTAGPPTSRINLTGNGFGASETVQVTFDGTLLNTAATTTGGTFSLAATIPPSALPGKHQIKASGRRSRITAQASFLVETDWAYDGYDKQRTHDNPYENVINPTNVSHLTLDWQYQTGSTINTSPVVVDGILYVTSSDEYLYALDAQTGALKWRFLLGKWPNSPTIADGYVYVSPGGGPLYALDAKTGQQKWTFLPNVRKDYGLISSSAVVANGIVYIGASNSYMFALDAKTGYLKWKRSMQTGILASVAISNGVVYVPLGSGDVAALNAQTGVVIWWDGGFSNDAFGNEAVVADGYLFLTTYYSLFVFNASTGKILWHYFSSYPSDSYSVAVAGGIVYVGLGKRTFYAFAEKTGHLLWTFQSASMVLASPAVANGVVYFCYSTTGKLYALDARSGAKLWSYDGGFYISSPIVVNGMVYIGTYNGYLDAFHLPTAQP